MVDKKETRFEDIPRKDREQIELAADMIEALIVALEQASSTPETSDGRG